MEQTLTKRCSICGVVKSVDDYYVKDKATGRLYARCKGCQTALSKASYQSDLESNREARRAYAAAHADENAERLRQWRAAHPERQREIDHAADAKRRDAHNQQRRDKRAAARQG